MTWLWVALAGACGALARYGLHAVVQTRSAARSGSRFPWGTVVVNLSGSFVLGLLVGLVVYQGLDPEARTIAGTGFLGAYTTFSSYSFETFGLVEDALPVAAVLNAVGSVVAGLALATAGFLLASLA
jgi:CrcB protein